MQGESWPDYIIRLKTHQLTPEIRSEFSQYLEGKHQGNVLIQALRSVFKRLLLEKAGIHERDLNDQLRVRINRLLANHIKQRLNLTKISSIDRTPWATIANKAGFDLHFHYNSIFVYLYPESKCMLPDFVTAYNLVNTSSTSHVQSMPKSVKEKALITFLKDVGYVIEAQANLLPSKHTNHASSHIIFIKGNPRDKVWFDNNPSFNDQHTGMDLCGHETSEDPDLGQLLRRESKADRVIRVHMGETVISSVGQQNITKLLDAAEVNYSNNSSKPLRIGHGTHACIGDMLRIADNGYYVEACLSSNKRGGIIDKRSCYPLGLMLLLGVKVVIGTDGGPLYETSLGDAYYYANKVINKFFDKISAMSNEDVCTPGGDKLLFKHIKHLCCNNSKKHNEDVISYADLKNLLKSDVFKRIGIETLVNNTKTLFNKCYGSSISTKNKRKI